MNPPGRRASNPGLAHAINNALGALIPNLELVAEALEGDTSLAERIHDALEPLREARESAERIRAIAEQLQGPDVAPAPSTGALSEMSPFEVPRATEALRPARSNRRTSVLVVDDEATIGRAVARSLRGYDVVVLDNGNEALARIVAGERFEIILCDLMMPGMTGMDLYEEVVRLAPEQAQGFVFVSGGTVTKRAREFVRTVPNLVLGKPFDVQRVRDLVRGRQPRSDHVVLVADDDDATRAMIVRRLSGAGFGCIEHSSGSLAIQELIVHPDAVDAVVLDVMMPGLNGLDVLAQLKETPETAHIPVVLMTAHAVGESDVARGIGAGASFYLTKPFSGPVLVAQVRAACERSDADRELRLRLDFAEEHATTDALTGLMNRRAFEDRLAEAVANATRHKEPLSVAMLDLDHFKRVNDTFGHAGGDRVLLFFARAVRRVVRVGDQAFRYGGEEFALVLPKCDAEGALHVVARLQHELRERPVSLQEGKAEHVRFSGGIATAAEGNGFRVEELVARADAALYEAKNGGRDRVEIGE